MLGGGEDIFDGAVFYDGTEVHDVDVVADVADDVDFVGDEDDGYAEALIEIAEEVEDFGGGFWVEGGGGFVA